MDVEEKEKQKEIKENFDENSRKKSITEKIRENPWIISTFVLGILTVILLLGNFSGGLTGNVVSKEKAGDNLIQYLSKAIGAEVELIDVEEFGGLYKVIIGYEGEKIPLYVTKDGSYYTNFLMPILSKIEQKTQTTSQDIDIPKTDKPKVELFVMSHCPYGTQAEKGIIPVVRALDNNIDFNVRFVFYAMHPSYGEVEEQLNQYCIQEEQRDKYLDYLECFLEEGDGEKCLDKAKIDKDKLSSCVSKVDKEFNVMKNLNDKSSWLNGRYPKFDIYKDLNEEYGIQGSPTLVINGKKVNSGRSPSAFLDVICQAFTDDKVPEACGIELPSQTYSPGFGYEATSSSSTNAQCG
ncbi:hypothetical protein DRN69_02270 [Candidatus Pacearchaeota archaeon]|mgnify:CR=1 FL=1|nr:MAG: hypothetical protein DRN69_02270 [Candidatus Pacearchaeota archaeon]